MKTQIDFSVRVSIHRVSSFSLPHDKTGFDGRVFGPLSVLVAGAVTMAGASEMEFLRSLAAVVELEFESWVLFKDLLGPFGSAPRAGGGPIVKIYIF